MACHALRPMILPQMPYSMPVAVGSCRTSRRFKGALSGAARRTRRLGRARPWWAAGGTGQWAKLRQSVRALLLPGPGPAYL